jgi:hypothetical protein
MSSTANVSEEDQNCNDKRTIVKILNNSLAIDRTI